MAVQVYISSRMRKNVVRVSTSDILPALTMMPETNFYPEKKWNLSHVSHSRVVFFRILYFTVALCSYPESRIAVFNLINDFNPVIE